MDMILSFCTIGDEEKMTNQMYDLIESRFPMTEIDCGEYKTQKIKGMKFKISAYYAEGLGHVSIMTAEGFFGLMKMDTLIINPTSKDMPLFSYDRVLAAGNDTLIFELYDTFLNSADMSLLEEVKKSLRTPDHDLGEHWYDSIKLPVSVSKKGKKTEKTVFDKFVLSYLNTYLDLAENVDTCDAGAKKEKASVYVEGLLKNGGPSTDIFMKALGREKTENLFRNILFGTAK